MQEISIVPKPLQLTALEGTFELGPSTHILVSESTRAVGQYLRELLQAATGYALTVTENHEENGEPDTILLTTSKADASLGEEGYELTVTPGGVVLRAPHPAGLFHGIQTLRQLLPAEIESGVKVEGVAWVAPAVAIRDRPRFAWRGMMLDTGRHMFTPAFIKRTIDLMAMHKMNVFHWHLTEDQGWRIEIKKYPKLTETGAWREGSPCRRNGNNGWQTLWRLLYPGADPRDRGICRQPVYHGGAGDRNARACHGCAGQLPGTRLHRRALCGAHELGHRQRMFSAPGMNRLCLPGRCAEARCWRSFPGSSSISVETNAPRNAGKPAQSARLPSRNMA